MVTNGCLGGNWSSVFTELFPSLFRANWSPGVKHRNWTAGPFITHFRKEVLSLALFLGNDRCFCQSQNYQQWGKWDWVRFTVAGGWSLSRWGRKCRYHWPRGRRGLYTALLWASLLVANKAKGVFPRLECKLPSLVVILNRLYNSEPVEKEQIEYTAPRSESDTLALRLLPHLQSSVSLPDLSVSFS